MRFVQQSPSGETQVDAFARELVALLGYTAPDGSNSADDARVIGAGIATTYGALGDAAAESFVTEASALLAEWESRLRSVSPAQSTTAERRAALAAIRRAGGANSRAAFLTALQAIDPTASVHTGSALENATYPRGVFVLSVRVAPSVLASSTQYARIEDVLERMAPPHVVWRLASNEGFFVDDTDSLVDTTGDVLAE